jgi:hypothetical protein
VVALLTSLFLALMLKVAFFANVLDLGMQENARYFRARLNELGPELSGEFGGPMDELWIDIELIPTRRDARAAHLFRFQRRVSGRAPYSGMPAIPDAHNVGHYSVRPDFARIRETPPAKPFSYLLGRILASFDILRGKRSIRGFDVDAFVATFHRATSKLEFRIDEAA